MTTIATDGLSMAGDSLVTAGKEVVGYTVKVVRLKDGRIVGTSGCCFQTVKFVEYLENPKGKKPEFEGDEFSALILNTDGTVDYMNKEFVPVRYLTPMTIGSGDGIALGAMLAGKSPVEAVAIAITRDTCSGGDIVSLSIEKPVRAVA